MRPDIRPDSRLDIRSIHSSHLLNAQMPSSSIMSQSYLCAPTRYINPGYISAHLPHIMVIILDGNSEYVAHEWGQKAYVEKKILFVNTLDLPNALNRSHIPEQLF